MEEVTEIDQLLEQHTGIWQTASILQGNADETKQFVPALQDLYHAWYYRALNLLPEDMRPSFRQQYEGVSEKGIWIDKVTVGIRQFIEDPLLTHELIDINADLVKHPSPPRPPRYAWEHPFEKYFRGQFLSQVATLRQARAFYIWRKPAVPTQELIDVPSGEFKKPTDESKIDRTVFVSHGRGHLYLTVVQFLDKQLGLVPLAFGDEPIGGFHNVSLLNDYLDRSRFAVIVATGDDAAVDGSRLLRPNVIHEIGLFQGRLGFEKVAIMRQDHAGPFSNLDGYQELRFKGDDIEGKFEDLRGMLRREGMRFKEPAN